MSPVPLSQLQMAPILSFLIFSGIYTQHNHPVLFYQSSYAGP